MKRLRIAQIAPPFIPVPPKNYGGTELMISNLTEELVRRGHDVTLFASGDSQTAARLESCYPTHMPHEKMSELFSPLSEKLYWMHSLPAFMHVVCAYEQATEFDIIHDHTHYLGLLFSNLVRTPTLRTYHGNLSIASQSSIEKQMLEKYATGNWVGISKHQMAASPIPLNVTATIPHGVNHHELTFNAHPGEYLLWLGRITERKGVSEAIQVADATHNELIIAGVVHPRDQLYFDKKVKPFLSTKIRYIGPADFSLKRTLLQGAKALLYPVNWDEPFGLVTVEAMSCGTPVIAYRRGAVPEVVKHGETGWVVDTLDEMIINVHTLDTMNPQEVLAMRRTCRKRVEKFFTVEKMTDRYEKVYWKILQKTNHQETITKRQTISKYQISNFQ